MTKVNKLIVYPCILLLLAFLIHSQADGEQNSDIYSDSNRLNEQLKNNPDSVDYSKIDYTDLNLDYKLLKYDRIPPDKFKDLDGSRVDYPSLFQSIGRPDLNVQINNYKLSLEKNSDGEVIIIHPSNSDQRIVLNNVPQGSLLIVRETYIEIKVPNKASDIDVTKIGSGVISTLDEATLFDGTRFSGRLSFAEGNIFVKQGDTLIVNNVEIRATDRNVGVNKIYDGNGIFFGANSIKILGDGYTTSFLPSNIYTNVKEHSILSVSPNNGATITIENRGIQKNPPLLTITGHSNQDLWANVKNGIYDMDFGSKGVININVDELLRSTVDSVPVEMQVLDQNNENLITDKDGKSLKLIINDKNELGAFDVNAQFDEEGGISCSGSISTTGDAIIDITGEGVVGAFGKTCDLITGFFGVKIPTARENEILKQAIERDYGIKMTITPTLSTSQVNDALRRIDFVLDGYDKRFLTTIKEIKVEEFAWLEGGHAEKTPQGSVVYLQYVSLNTDLIHHELYHALRSNYGINTFSYTRDISTGIVTSFSTNFALDKNPTFFGDYEQFQRIMLERMQQGKGFEQGIQYYKRNTYDDYNNWIKLNPDGENAYLNSYLYERPIRVTFEISKSSVIRPAGFITGYGKTNPEEDQATVYEFVATHSLDDIKKLSAEDLVLKSKLDIMGKIYLKFTGKGPSHPWYPYFYGQKEVKK